ncbi:MAG: UDP-glucose dehydrogenase [Candidatus Shapirobacteria bacterium GW2011_GWE1_38_10]|uniref:UDP-glucose dehydrogenase n=1 Tax=Candidatus Shapirobacteria bacterium GW2011_GWE1_38_10 TaxID=1618488 RepID=A0A0G0KGY1_9BACT|nr:MAG: UDP-glucose dehydrogenase [Candidatus Shapirobacteria bacterium GW2011_GWE1_38_10]
MPSLEAVINNNFCVIGYGMVGKATAVLFHVKKHFDVNKTRSNISLREAAKCKFVFICLPTPEKAGKYQVDGIIKTIENIESYGNSAIYIIRSTVYPGFANEIQKNLKINRIVSNPEFLSEDTWKKDVKYPPFVLIGGISKDSVNQVRKIYKIRVGNVPIVVTDNTTAELAKLAMNSYFATKVIFANQVYDYANKIDANYETIKNIMESHPFGPKNHFTIWYKGKRGVNGNCLPKDSKAMAHYSGSVLMKTIINLNKNLIKKKLK